MPTTKGTRPERKAERSLVLNSAPSANGSNERQLCWIQGRKAEQGCGTRTAYHVCDSTLCATRFLSDLRTRPPYGIGEVGTAWSLSNWFRKNRSSALSWLPRKPGRRESALWLSKMTGWLRLTCGAKSCRLTDSPKCSPACLPLRQATQPTTECVPQWSDTVVLIGGRPSPTIKAP